MLDFVSSGDVPEPGYSQITQRGGVGGAGGAGRPHSVVSSTSGRRSPVYAIVDKSRKPRPQTIAGPCDPDDPLYSQVTPDYQRVGNGVNRGNSNSTSGVDFLPPPPPPPIQSPAEPYYSQVNKTHTRSASASAASSMSTKAVINNNHGGAAANIMIASTTGVLPSSSTASNHVDYHSISDSMLMPNDDPDYDQVQEVTAPISPPEEFDEFDPNYAELQDTAIAAAGIGSGSAASTSNQLPPPPQQQIAPPQFQPQQQQQTMSMSRVRAEPIYQEISEGTML